MNLTKLLATIAGDIWISKRCVALWPWPAVVRNYPESKLSGQHYRRLMDVLKPGDMLLTRGDLFEISNKGIPEKFTHLKHLAVFVGNVDGELKDHFIEKATPGRKYERCVIHAISEGIKCQDILDLFRHCDELVAIRPWSNDNEQKTILQTAFEQLNKPYDFNFKKGTDALYCTELGATCLKAAQIQPPGTTRINTRLLGLLLPLDYFKDNVWVADAFIRTFKRIF